MTEISIQYTMGHDVKEIQFNVKAPRDELIDSLTALGSIAFDSAIYHGLNVRVTLLGKPGTGYSRGTQWFHVAENHGPCLAWAIATDINSLYRDRYIQASERAQIVYNRIESTLSTLGCPAEPVNYDDDSSEEYDYDDIES